MREFKGQRISTFPSEYVVIDTETTGLDPSRDFLIEIAAIKVHNSEIIDTFSSLINPGIPVDSYITKLTGITNEELQVAPAAGEVLFEYYNFIGQDIVVGHNVHFDINFLYDAFIEYIGKIFSNNFIDTLPLSRKYLKGLSSYKLSELTKTLDIPVGNFHRALSDCEATNFLFEKIKNLPLSETTNSNTSHYICTKDIVANNTDFDESHPLYNKTCVFTGTLAKMDRKNAMQIVVDFGGHVSNSVTQKTNYLVIGNYDYCPSVKDGKSTKQKKAESLKLTGKDIEIISEDVFYDMITQD